MIFGHPVEHKICYSVGLINVHGEVSVNCFADIFTFHVDDNELVAIVKLCQWDVISVRIRDKVIKELCIVV